MSFNCSCSTRNPSWPNGESISWYALPGIMACKLRISAGVKMMSVVMPTTSVRAVMLLGAAITAVLTFLGTLFGQRLLRKHFQKAGIVG